jgi:hypothetical protein
VILNRESIKRGIIRKMINESESRSPANRLSDAERQESLRGALEFMRTYEEGISAVRYPRDVVSDRFVAETCPPFVLGKARCLTPACDVLDEGGVAPDVAVLAFGVPVFDALDVAVSVAPDIRVGVWDARFAKPIDEALIVALLPKQSTAGQRFVAGTWPLPNQALPAVHRAKSLEILRKKRAMWIGNYRFIEAMRTEMYFWRWPTLRLEALRRLQ